MDETAYMHSVGKVPYCATCYPQVKDSDDGMTFELAGTLREASSRGHTHCVDRFLRKGAIDVNARMSEYGLTALMCACGYGHDDTVGRLLQEGNIDVNIVDGAGRTALMWACLRGHFKCVDRLVDANKGIDVNIVCENEGTALRYACLRNHVECARRLLEVKNMNADALVDEDVHRALHISCAMGNVGCVDLLLGVRNFDVNEVNTTRYTGYTALMMACAGKGEGQCIERLLAVQGIDVNAKTDKGVTALITACIQGHVECVERLLSVRDIDINANVNGKTALAFACRRGHVDCAKRIVEVNITHENVTGAIMESLFNCKTESVKVIWKSRSVRRSFWSEMKKHGWSAFIKLATYALLCACVYCVLYHLFIYIFTSTS